MKKLGYALHRGEVYKKVASSKYTFQHCCKVKQFLSLLGDSEHFKEPIVKRLNKLDSILGGPESEFPRQLRINYDLIEVSDGFCFSISERKLWKTPYESWRLVEKHQGHMLSTSTTRYQNHATLKKFWKIAYPTTKCNSSASTLSDCCTMAPNSIKRKFCP